MRLFSIPGRENSLSKTVLPKSTLSCNHEHAWECADGPFPKKWGVNLWKGMTRAIQGADRTKQRMGKNRRGDT